jgi:hypothetical protein
MACEEWDPGPVIGVKPIRPARWLVHHWLALYSSRTTTPALINLPSPIIIVGDINEPK